MFAPLILRFESLPSTNAEAIKRAVDGAPEGLCVIAGEQTAGRGRLDRAWVSPKGAGLYFSILLRPSLDPRTWPLLTLMSAVAVHEALHHSCGVRMDIKWPNDILAENRKLCGILAESVESQFGRAVVVGIGINLTNDAVDAGLENVATSVAAVTGEEPDGDRVLTALLSSLENYYQTLQRPGGPERIITEWTSRSTYANGRRLRVTNADEIVEGVSRGLEADGGLRVETETGEVRVVRAGDVSSVRVTSA